MAPEGRPAEGGLHPDEVSSAAPRGPAQLPAQLPSLEIRRAQLHNRIDRDFTYHAPKPGQSELYAELRDRFGELAHFLVDNVPEGRELSMALTDLERAVMAANAGIARHG